MSRRLSQGLQSSQPTRGYTGVFEKIEEEDNTTSSANLTIFTPPCMKENISNHDNSNVN